MSKDRILFISTFQFNIDGDNIKQLKYVNSFCLQTMPCQHYCEFKDGTSACLSSVVIVFNHWNELSIEDQKHFEYIKTYLNTTNYTVVLKEDYIPGQTIKEVQEQIILNSISVLPEVD